MSETPYSIMPLAIPEDAGWDLNGNKPPEELRRVIELYQGALNDDVDGSPNEIDDMGHFYDVFDEIADQTVVVARDTDEKIVGVASFDMQRQTPFFEGVSVAPYHRGKGVAGMLVAYILSTAIEQGASVMHCRSQPSSVGANVRILEKSGFDFEIDSNSTYPHITIHLL